VKGVAARDYAGIAQEMARLWQANLVFETLAAKSRDSLHLIDSTVVKAHRAAAGAKGESKSRRSASAAAGAPRESMRSSMAKGARSALS
jgi:hypothetical protein